MEIPGEELKNKIKARANDLGFSLCGITKPVPPEGYPVYDQWLQSGFNSGMSYLESNYHRLSRQVPRKLMPEVESIICLGFPYSLHKPETLYDNKSILIAGYASGEDYHLALPARMQMLVNDISSWSGKSIQSRLFTDSAPILERELAQKAGFGWIGKNSCLISPKIGSSFILSEIFIDLHLEPDLPFEKDLCGSCRRCLEACPTKCIKENRTIDSNKCISYHTIENKGEIPENIADKLGNWLFGCDICQMVCPWNRRAVKGNDENAWSISQVIDLIQMDSAEFTIRYKNSPLLRPKYTGLIRNSLIILSRFNNHISRMITTDLVEKSNDSVLINTAKMILQKLHK